MIRRVSFLEEYWVTRFGVRVILSFDCRQQRCEILVPNDGSFSARLMRNEVKNTPDGFLLNGGLDNDLCHILSRNTAALRVVVHELVIDTDYELAFSAWHDRIAPVRKQSPRVDNRVLKARSD